MASAFAWFLASDGSVEVDVDVDGEKIEAAGRCPRKSRQNSPPTRSLAGQTDTKTRARIGNLQ